MKNLFKESEYDIPEKGTLAAPNEEFKNNRRNHYGYSVYATASNPLAAGVIETTATNVIGTGFNLRSTIKHNAINMTHEKAASLQDSIEEGWNIFCEDVELSNDGDMCLDEIADIAYRTQLITGNCFCLLKPDNTRSTNFSIKLLDSAFLYEDYLNININNSDRVDGISYGKNGIISKYKFFKKHPYLYGAGIVDETISIPKFSGIRENVLHLKTTKRAGQVVAFPIVSIIAMVLEDIKDYTKAEIDAAKLNAHFAGVVYNDNMVDAGDFSEDENDGGEITIGKGNMFKLDKGWKINFADPARPAKEYGGFIESKIKELCIAINIPFEMFMKLFNSSYTASRGAVIEGQKNFKVKRKNITKSFYQKIYERYILEEVIRGRLVIDKYLTDRRVRLAICSSEWLGERQEDMNMLNAIKASDAACKAGFSTRDRETKKIFGGSFEENMKTSAVETKKMEDSKCGYVGDMNPQKAELKGDKLKNGDKKSQFGDKKQKGNK